MAAIVTLKMKTYGQISSNITVHQLTLYEGFMSQTSEQVMLADHSVHNGDTDLYIQPR